MDKTALVLAAMLLAASPAWATVDVNTATKDQLEAEGIGHVAAQAIIDHRTRHGPFTSGDEVRKVIDDAIASRLSIGISLSGPPQAAASNVKPAAAPKEEKQAAVPKAERPVAKAPAEANEKDNVRNNAKKDADDRKT